MSIGQQFRAAREMKILTVSQAALATRIKTQLVESMERDDFSGFAAPTYAKGFIKLYAEFLGLDPHPLIDEYMEFHATAKRISLESKPQRFVKQPKQPKEPKEPRERKPIEWAWLNRIKEIRISRESVVRITTGILMIALIVVMVAGISYVFRSCAQKRALKKAEQKTPVSTEVVASEILQEPPEPYIGSGATPQDTP